MNSPFAVSPLRRPLLMLALLCMSACIARADDTPPAPAPVPPPPPVAPLGTAHAGMSAPKSEGVVIPETPVATGTPPPKKPSLADRVKAFATAGAGVAQLTAQVASLTAERDRFEQRCQTLGAELLQARQQIEEITTALDGQRNVVLASATEIATTVGIPAAALPAPAGEAGEKPSLDQLAQAVREAKTPQERMKAHAAWAKAQDAQG